MASTFLPDSALLYESQPSSTTPQQSAVSKMDINKLSFYPLLLDILTGISESLFVAVDLELSGIPAKQPFGSGAGKPSLQQRYLETKQAAERYQILQFGLTCVRQDFDNGRYVLQPYNFTLSPVIEEKGLDVERIFSFQSGAIDFLLKSNFDMSAPFLRGVPYLSKVEIHEALKKHDQRQDRGAISDIQIKPTETESLAFLERVRQQISSWKASKDVDTQDYVNIGLEDGDIQAELSRFEKRLVHQLVRAEFPDLVTVSRRGWIQVVRYNKEREDRIAAGRKREFEERVNRQKGFSWIIAALRGSDLSELDLRECARDPSTGEHIYYDAADYRAQFDRAHSRIRGRPRILIGHNCFLDFVYIYRQFIGTLPETVEEFQEKLHELWPTIVDTKYMSTHNCGDINPVSSLEQIASKLREQATPIVETDPDHDKYAGVHALHEAGYDSYLTAQIAVRLSAKLENVGAYVDVENEAKGDEKDVSDRLAKVTVTNHEPRNVSEEPETSFTPSVPEVDWKGARDSTLPPHEPYEPDEAVWGPEDRGIEGGMPGWRSDFWRVYGNKMRVFGTEEGVCLLDAGAGEEEEDGEGQGGIKL